MIFDLCILGGGVAGTTAALHAAQKGLRAALVFDAPPGGVCLHEGCIPAKVCLETAFSDMASLSAYRQKTVDTLYAGLQYRLQDSGVTLVHGHGTYTKEGALFCVRVSAQTLQCKNLLLATGATAVHLAGTVTPEQIFCARTLPQTALILGGGAAGLEAATYLKKMGTTVTLIERGERLLPQADADISAALLRGLRRKGITVKLRTDATAYPFDGVDAVVCALGRTAAPITPMDGLYVAGDACGSHCTAHAAMREAECAVNRICGEADTVDYNSIPNVVFSDPQCAYIGTTGDRAAAVALKSNGGYLASGGDGSGLLKLFADGDTVCGMQICGGNASELIGIGSVLVSGRVSVATLEKTVFAHPTVSEAIRTAAQMLLHETKERDI